MFCKHEWALLSETTTTSKFDDSVRAFSHAGGAKFTLPDQLCCADRKHIQVFTCGKCGNLKRFVEEI